MSYLNITKRETQATGLGVMNGRCSPDSQHGRTDRHPANIACSLFRYMNDDISNHNDQRPKRKTWIREDNPLALHCYFRSNPSQSGHRKRTIEIWQECASFQTTSQRLTDQVRTIMKKGWFSDLEILDIHQKTQSQDSTITNTLSGTNKKQHIRNELQTLENEYATVPSNPTETLSQEQQTNLKRIMKSVKTTLPSLRNIEWRTLKTETNKINQIIPYISTNNINELNDLIYAGAKLVCEKIGVPPPPKKARRNHQNQDGKFNWKPR